MLIGTTYVYQCLAPGSLLICNVDLNIHTGTYRCEVADSNGYSAYRQLSLSRDQLDRCKCYCSSKSLSGAADWCAEERTQTRISRTIVACVVQGSTTQELIQWSSERTCHHGSGEQESGLSVDDFVVRSTSLIATVDITTIRE